MSASGRITGIGGVFFKCRNPETTRAWYRDSLGMEIDESYGGASFEWRDRDDPNIVGCTIWSPFDQRTDYFAPGMSEFMINFRVDDLDAVLARLAEEDVVPVGLVENHPEGRFAWVVDPDGRKIELWEPLSQSSEPPPP